MGPCQKCIYWRRSREPEQQYGECRRHAPTASAAIPLRQTVRTGPSLCMEYDNTDPDVRTARWAITHKSDWCGEQEEK